MRILSESGLPHANSPSRDVCSSVSPKKRSNIAAQGVLFSLLSLFSVASNSAEPSSPVTDGPYVFLDQGKENTAYWICQSELKQTPIANNQLARPNDCGNLPQPLRHNAAPQIEADTYKIGRAHV